MLKDGANNWFISVLLWAAFEVVDIVFDMIFGFISGWGSMQKLKRYDVILTVYVSSMTSFLPDVISPIIPSLFETSTLNPYDPTSEEVYYFMSYEWFTTVALDITMIFVSKMIGDIILQFFEIMPVFRKTFFLLVDSRTASEHSLDTFMPKEYPLDDRLSNIVVLVFGCSVAGFLSPIVFLLFSIYVLVFMAVEMDNAFKYKRVRSLSPDIFSALAIGLHCSYPILIIISFLSMLRIFFEIHASRLSFIVLIVVTILLLLFYTVMLIVHYRFYNKYNEFERANERDKTVSKDQRTVGFEEISSILADYEEVNPLFEDDPRSIYIGAFFSYCEGEQAKESKRRGYTVGDPTVLWHNELNVDVNEFRGIYSFLVYCLDYIFKNKNSFKDLRNDKIRDPIIRSIIEGGLYDGMKDFSSEVSKWGFPFLNMPLKEEVEMMMNVYFSASYERLRKNEGIWESLSFNRRICEKV
jgi:hypothetical protein